MRATEYDAGALEVAKANVKHNDIQNTIELTHGDAKDAAVQPSNLVVANVTIGVHRRICANYSRAERVLVAGVLCNQVAEMIRLMPQHHPKIIKTSGDWAAVDFRRTTLREPRNDR